MRYRQRELNVILVEWESGSTQTYPQSVANTRIVAAEMARLLKITQVLLDSLIVYVNYIPRNAIIDCFPQKYLPNSKLCCDGLKCRKPIAGLSSTNHRNCVY